MMLIRKGDVQVEVTINELSRYFDDDVQNVIRLARKLDGGLPFSIDEEPESEPQPVEGWDQEKKRQVLNKIEEVLRNT